MLYNWFINLGCYVSTTIIVIKPIVCLIYYYYYNYYVNIWMCTSSFELFHHWLIQFLPLSLLSSSKCQISFIKILMFNIYFLLLLLLHIIEHFDIRDLVLDRYLNSNSVIGCQWFLFKCIYYFLLKKKKRMFMKIFFILKTNMYRFVLFIIIVLKIVLVKC